MVNCKKLFVPIVVLLVLLSSLLTVQVNCQVPWVEWSQTYDGTGGCSVVGTSDGGYVLAGSTHDIDPNVDFWLVKTDGYGTVEWNQTYGGTDYDSCSAMIATSDGGYALAGSTWSYGNGNRDFWLVKTDGYGNVEWNQTYGTADVDVAASLIQTSDGGYALAGYRQYINVDGVAVFWFVKTDSSGNMEWNKVFSGGGINHASSVLETSDGGYVILGRKQSMGATYGYAWLIKTDKLGNIEWDQSYEGTFGDLADTLIETSDGGIAFACHTYLFGAGSADFWLIKLDMSGNIELNQTYGGAEKDIPYSLVETFDGGFSLAGSTESFGYGNTDFWLVKTDESGKMEWNRFYGSPEHEIACSLIENSDGGYTLAGNQDLWDTGEQKIWLIRTNIQGIPEFPSWIILPMLLILSLAVIICRKKLTKKTK
ncbi:MAG: hypothetical protein NWF06_06210 [Candidatus Bathyarchaeota archaeon]|nr:hypothetical protein [Candidatus Bathyarchaeum sp.]